MRKFFQFFSLTLATQGILLLNQLALLPIQLRIWGQDLSAQWYTMLGIAAIVSVADGGLRTAGHAELIRCAKHATDLEAKHQFQHLWAWIRILIGVVTIVLIALSLCYHWLGSGRPYPFWGTILIAGITCETIVSIRVMYLDTLELYRQAEAGYLLLVSARLGVALAALVFWHASPFALAWIWLGCGLFATLQQNRLCRRLGLLRLFEPLPPSLSWRTLALCRYTLADPVQSWMRAYVPVLVLSGLGQPVAVTIYVALRAVFGTARQVILQLARFASVQYVWLKSAHRGQLAETQFSLAILFAAFFASVITGIVVTDNFRLAALWLAHSDRVLYSQIAITFGLASPLYAYQIMQALMLRHGAVPQIAHRQYIYITVLVLFSAIALATKSLWLWLWLILLAEITVSLLFLFAPELPKNAGGRGLLAASASASLSLGLWLVVVCFEPFDFLGLLTASALLPSLAFLAAWVLVLVVSYLYIGQDLLSEARTLVQSALTAFFGPRQDLSE